MTMKRAAVLAALGGFAALAAPGAQAQPGMGMIGQRMVGPDVDHDTVPARGGTRYNELMICVEEAPVRFMEVVVRFQNGTSQNVRLRSLVAAGRCSRSIELHGRERDISGVDFTYESASLAGVRARVQLFAR